MFLLGTRFVSLRSCFNGACRLRPTIVGIDDGVCFSAPLLLLHFARSNLENRELSRVKFRARWFLYFLRSHLCRICCCLCLSVCPAHFLCFSFWCLKKNQVNNARNGTGCGQGLHMRQRQRGAACRVANDRFAFFFSFISVQYARALKIKAWSADVDVGDDVGITACCCCIVVSGCCCCFASLIQTAQRLRLGSELAANSTFGVCRGC